MNKLIMNLSVFLLFGVLSGCSGYISPRSRINGVLVTPIAAPKNCQFIKQISVYDVNGATMMYTSAENIHRSQINQLKINALTLGANYVYLISEQKSYKTRLSGTYVDRQLIIGKSYYCPENGK